MADLCKACGESLSEKKGDRKSLTGDAAGVRSVYGILMLFLTEGCPRYQPSVYHEYLSKEPAFVCKSCFNLLKKYSDMRDNLERMRSRITRDFNMSCSSDSQALEQNDSQLRKRTWSSAIDMPDESPAKRPRLQDTTRRKLFVPGAGGQASPAVTVVVGYEKKPSYFHLTQSLKKLGRYVGRGNRRSIARAAVDNSTLRPELVTAMCRTVGAEIKCVCSDSRDSILRMKNKTALEHFTWETVWSELEQKAPTLTAILLGLAPTSKRESEYIKPALSLCASILLKLRNDKVNLVQSVISLVMKAGHASKQVFTRLHKLGICLTHTSTVALMENIADGHDEEVLEWQDDLVVRVPSPDPMVSTRTQTQPPLHLPSEESELDMDVSGLFDISLDGESLTPPCVQSPRPADIQSPVSPPFSPVTPVQDGSSDVHLTSTPLPNESGVVLEETNTTPLSQWHGFKYVGDNIDKNIKPRHQTLDSQGKSLHYFHYYALMDRIDLSTKSDEPPSETVSLTIDDILPTEDDYTTIVSNFATLTSRVICEHIAGFAPFKHLVKQHIEHVHQKEMCQRSKVVPLGIIMKNENKVDEMVDILSSLQQYVPTKEATFTVDIPEVGTTEMKVENMHKILLGGDQLTAERARAACRVRQNSQHPAGRLEGTIPVAEDWHTKVCFMEVLWKRLYKEGAYKDAGTLAQLKSLTNRTNVPKKPKVNVNAAEDFLNIVMEAHIIAATLKHFKMENCESDLPATLTCELQSSEGPSAFHKHILNMLIGLINLPIRPGKETGDHGSCADGVFAYASEVLTLSLLNAEFEDAIKEGDGERVVRCWRFFLPIFKSSNRTKYSLEAVKLLVNTHVLPPRLREQLIWSRFVNTKGKAGDNKPCDLHMEHLNRTVKSVLGHQGSNLTPRTILRIGKCVGPLLNICKQFDAISSVRQPSGKHTQASREKDLKRIVNQLQAKDVFGKYPRRKHNEFKSVTGSIIERMDKNKFCSWLQNHLKEV